MTIENARIKNVSISMADHGCLTFTIWLSGADWECGFGGYCIGHGYLGAKEFNATGKGLVAMMKIMDTVGVEKWEDLKGKYCRVKTEGWGGQIKIIGNVIEDKWFDMGDFFKIIEKEEAK